MSIKLCTADDVFLGAGGCCFFSTHETGTENEDRGGPTHGETETPPTAVGVTSDDKSLESRRPDVRHVDPVSRDPPSRPSRLHVAGSLAASAFSAVPDEAKTIGAKRPAWALSNPSPSNSALPGRKRTRTRGATKNARGGSALSRKPPPKDTRDGATTSTNPAALQFRLRDFTPQRKPRPSLETSSLRGGGSLALVTMEQNKFRARVVINAKAEVASILLSAIHEAAKDSMR